LHQLSDVVESFGRSRDEDQFEPRGPRSQLSIDTNDDLFFRIVRTARDPDKVGRGDTQPPSEVLRLRVVPLREHAVVFHRAGHLHARRVHSEGEEMIGVGVGLHAKGRHPVEQESSSETGDAGVPSGGPRTHAAVDDNNWHAGAVGGAQKDGPEFTFGEDDELRFDRPNRSPNGPGEIEGIGDHMQIGEVLARLGQPGVGRRGDDDLPVRMSFTKRPHYLSKEMDLADADAVEPDDRLAGGEGKGRGPEEFGFKVVAITAGAK
jgi:hypothetical protein